MTLENGFSWPNVPPNLLDGDVSPARGHLIIAEACLGGPHQKPSSEIMSIT
jgi:hypothetical protein